jgi:actin-related protein
MKPAGCGNPKLITGIVPKMENRRGREPEPGALIHNRFTFGARQPAAGANPNPTFRSPFQRPDIIGWKAVFPCEHTLHASRGVEARKAARLPAISEPEAA